MPGTRRSIGQPAQLAVQSARELAFHGPQHLGAARDLVHGRPHQRAPARVVQEAEDRQQQPDQRQPRGDARRRGRQPHVQSPVVRERHQLQEEALVHRGAPSRAAPLRPFFFS